MNQEAATETSWWRSATWPDLSDKAVSKNPDDRERAVQEARRRVEEALAILGAETKDLGRLAERICADIDYDDDRKHGLFRGIAIRNRAVHARSDTRAPSVNDCLAAVTEYQLFLRAIATKILYLAGASSGSGQSKLAAQKRLHLHAKVQAVTERYGIVTDDESALLESTYALHEVEFEGFRAAIWELATSGPAVVSELAYQASQLYTALFFDLATPTRWPRNQPKFNDLKRQFIERKCLPNQRTTSSK